MIEREMEAEIETLKAQVELLRMMLWQRQYYIPQPYPVPYYPPWPEPYWPWPNPCQPPYKITLSREGTVNGTEYEVTA